MQITTNQSITLFIWDYFFIIYFKLTHHSLVRKESTATTSAPESSRYSKWRYEEVLVQTTKYSTNPGGILRHETLDFRLRYTFFLGSNNETCNFLPMRIESNQIFFP